MNIAQHVERGRDAHPDRTALRFRYDSWSYRQLDEFAARVGSYLRKRGCATGDRVALLLPNGPAFVVGFLAALRIGAIVTPVSTEMEAEEVGSILAACRPTLIVTCPELESRLSTDVSGAERLVVTEPTAGDEWDFVPTHDPMGPAVDLEPHTPAMLVHTCGTTGPPKGVLLTHSNVTENMAAKARYTNMRGDDRILLFLPLYHCATLNTMLNAGLHAGSTIVVMTGFDPSEVLETIRRESITMMFGVPPVFQSLLDAGASRQDLGLLSYVLSAGAPLPIQVQREWRARFGMVIQEGYGVTESSPFATYNHEREHRAGSVGTPIEGVEVEVVDSRGRVLPPGKPGEVVIRGHNVMLGYWNAPKATAEAIVDGWLRTGDVGRKDEDGYLYIIDRLADVVTVAERSVYPAEVERVLLAHPAVAEAAVFGRPHQTLGEVLCGRVVPAEGATATIEEIRAHCAGLLADFKVPSDLRFTSAIPKGRTGKPLKRTLAAETT